MDNHQPQGDSREQDFARIVSLAHSPEAPPLPEGFAGRLAARAQAATPASSDAPVWTAAISIASLSLLMALALNPSTRIEMKVLAAAAATANIALSPLAAVVVIHHQRRETHAKA
jgi:hypothetical protein